MSSHLTLQCRCGNVTGRVEGATPANTNRALCYCLDCQTFARALGRVDVLDADGGSDIVQTAPASVQLDAGAEHVECVRLSPTGLFRFCTTCCHTPFGNVYSTGVPFIGLWAGLFPEGVDEAFGPVRFKIRPECATRPVDAPSALRTLPSVARVFALISGWRLSGRAFPHPFFERGASEPRFPVRVLGREERSALRERCGPGAELAAG